ncbi:MAG TPA: tetratricopeptide repeat protein [Gammaproteobacteria bacterium]|nr:tetratricopeptide repeat protein [Gammaproteobacteria bacterium]
MVKGGEILCRTLLIAMLSACGHSDDPVALFEEGDYEAAYSLWQPRAENGDPVAQNYMGIHHYMGLGTRRDFTLAREWYEKAATQGYPDAQFNLGLMYENGRGVRQDYLAAFKWFIAAYEQGNDNALKHLKRIAEEHKLMPNQMTYADELARPYIMHRVERAEKAPRKNYTIEQR